MPGKRVRSLIKRVNEGEILVKQSEKSGWLLVISMEESLRARSVNTCYDVEVNQEFAKENHRLLNGNISCWLRILTLEVTGAMEQGTWKQDLTSVVQSLCLAFCSRIIRTGNHRWFTTNKTSLCCILVQIRGIN